MVIISLAGLLLVWARVRELGHSLWSDEAYTAIHYILPGPRGIFGQYIPNDHMLFELLSWATIRLTGGATEQTMRFWSVVPAIAAGVWMTIWLWRRLEPWVAATFAVLAAAAPLYLTLSSQARGYGLAYLAAVAMLWAFDGFMWRRRLRELAVFASSAIVGIWTLPVFVLAFLPLVALMAVRRPLRRHAAAALVVVGLASLVFYAPVLQGVLHSSSQHYGRQLPWLGIATGPLDDLINPSVSVFISGASISTSELIGAALVAAGFTILWFAPERYLALGMVAPALFSYAFLEAGRLYEADRFVSFLELPLLALCSVALVRGAWLIGRVTRHRLAGVGCLVAFSLFALAEATSSFNRLTRIPVENFAAVASLVDQSGIPTVVTNSTKPVGFFYYLGPRRVHLMGPSELEPLFCSNVAPFVYLEHGRSPLAKTGCLLRRGAVSVAVPQTRSYIHVWLVTEPISRGGRVRILRAPPLLRVLPPRSGITRCPVIVERESPGPGSLASTPAGHTVTAELRNVAPGVTAPVHLTVIGARLVRKVAGQFTAKHVTFFAPADFLLISYRMTNLGSALLKPEDTINSSFGVSGLAPGLLVMSAATFDKRCSTASPSAAVDASSHSPYTHLLSGQTVDTVALYPLPTGLTTSALARLRWYSPAVGVSLTIPLRR
jgi:hypothetical protein